MRLAAVLLAALVGCSSGRRPAPQADAAPADEGAEAAAVLALMRKGLVEEADRRAAALLARARDPAVLAAVVRHLAARGCPGLATALAGLDARADLSSSRVYLGLIDDAVDAAPGCAIDAGDGHAEVLAASYAARSPEDALALLARAPDSAPVHYRRADLFLRLRKSEEALAEMTAGLKLEDDVSARGQVSRIHLAAGRPEDALALVATGDDPELVVARVAAMTAAQHYTEAAREILRAPPDLWPRLAHAAAEAGDASMLAGFVQLRAARGRDAGVARPGVRPAEAELWMAAAEKLGLASAWLPLQHAAEAAPDDAAIHLALGEAEAARGEHLRALTALDRAAALQPASEKMVLAPIRWLARWGRTDEARARAAMIALAARAIAPPDADALSLASAAAAAAWDQLPALVLAREAVAARPDDGRLQLLLAQRLHEAGDKREAAEVLVRLLVHGAHGRPWHRHEVAAKLVEVLELVPYISSIVAGAAGTAAPE